MLDGFDFQKENRQKDDKNYVNITDVNQWWSKIEKAIIS